MAHDQPPRWQCFLGACFLTASFVIPRGGARGYAAGVVLAGCLQWVWYWVMRGGD
ncbi:MAG: hypothetical protein ABI211_18590 [Vicinamibacterales bacterium]